MQVKYDLEERTFHFAQNVRTFLKKIPRSVSNIEDAKQLVRSSGSVGANYIEANESLGKSDFKMRIRICRKEAKEIQYWLRLLELDASNEKERLQFIQEAKELELIFGAILRNSQ